MCPRSLHIPLSAHISASFEATEDDMQVEKGREGERRGEKLIVLYVYSIV